MRNGYAVRFDLEDSPPIYAGKMSDGALGFANTLETAEVWPSEEIAARFLANGYGPNMGAAGSVVEVVDGAEVVS